MQQHHSLSSLLALSLLLSAPMAHAFDCSQAKLQKINTKPLVGRAGSVMSDRWYNPALESGNTSHNPQKLQVRASWPDGSAAAGCQLNWQTQAPANGWAHPLAAVTDSRGDAFAYWVAGQNQQQQLVVSVAANPARQVSFAAAVRGHSTRANSVHLAYWSEQWQSFSVTLQPQSWPATTYYSAINFPGGYTGIQNHQLLFSVWDSDDAVPARVIKAAAGVSCSEFGGEGTGAKCEMPFAPKTNGRYQFTVSLSYPDASHTDYQLHVTDLDAGTAPLYFATLRYGKKTAPTGAYSFVEDWADEQSSCLAHQARAVLISQVRYKTAANSAWQALNTAFPTAVYTPDHNEICASYAFGQQDGQFRLSTGGSGPFSAPLHLPEQLGPVQIELQPAR